MRDIDDGHALRAQAFDGLKHDLLFLLRQRGGGLVHDQQAAVAVDRLADLDHLLLRHGKVGYDLLHVQRKPQLRQQLVRLDPHALPVDQTIFIQPLAQEHVFSYGKRFGKLDLLMHHADARRLRFAGRLKAAALFAIEVDLALFRLVNARQNLDKRRFARAVFAHQRMHRAALNIEGNVIQRLDAGEALAYSPQFEDIIAHRASIPLISACCAPRPAPRRRP